MEVTDEQVDEQLDRLRRMQATLEPVEREVRMGDVVRADVAAALDGEEQFRQEDAEFPIREGVEISLPGFSKKLLGMKRGKEKPVLGGLPG